MVYLKKINGSVLVIQTTSTLLAGSLKLGVIRFTVFKAIKNTKTVADLALV